MNCAAQPNYTTRPRTLPRRCRRASWTPMLHGMPQSSPIRRPQGVNQASQIFPGSGQIRPETNHVQKTANNPKIVTSSCFGFCCAKFSAQVTNMLWNLPRLQDAGSQRRWAIAKVVISHDVCICIPDIISLILFMHMYIYTCMYVGM